MIKLELDMAVTDEELASLLQEHPAGQPVAARLVTAHGPGSGWPLLAWTGEPAALHAWLLTNYVWDEAEADELLATATAVS